MCPVPETAPRRRVLFVDDEQLVLSGLRRSLRSMARQFDLEFASDGSEALEMMSRSRFDAVVSDMRMPGMSGADLLAEVHRLYPGTARIILSGQSDPAQLMQCVGCAHRVLPKPCPPAELESVLTQISAIQGTFDDDVFMRTVVSMERVPAVPELYLRLVEAVQRPEFGLDEVGDLIEQEPGTTIGLLRIVNSAFFGLARRISDAREAARFLGAEVVKALVLAEGAFRHFESNRRLGEQTAGIWHHSMAAAALARRIGRCEQVSQKVENECFVAGLLHDVGKLILADNFEQLWERTGALAAREHLVWHAAETREFGLTHADIAGGILGLWGLPTAVVDAVQHHHEPSRSVIQGFCPLIAVHVADALLHEENPERDKIPIIDASALARAGLADRLPAWRKLKLDEGQGPL